MGATLTFSIGLGLIVSLGFSEILGLTAGGLVVPGYMALHLDHPLMIAATLVISIVTYFLVNSLGTVAIVYGRRRTALMILIGFALGGVVNNLGDHVLFDGRPELALVGHVIPGLIAIWIDRQGLLECLASLIIASAIVRMMLIIFVGKVVI